MVLVKILLYGWFTKRSGVLCYQRWYNYKIFSTWERSSSRWPNFNFLFVLALEILFILIKSKPEIEGMTIFDYNYLYSAYADDTTFFLKDIISVKHMVDTFLFFSYFSGLKPNLKKSEIAGIGVLPESCSSGSLRYALYRSECWYFKNIRYPFLL